MQQEKIIAIIFVIAALIFSAVTYSFAHRTVVVQNTSAAIITIPDITPTTHTARYANASHPAFVAESKNRQAYRYAVATPRARLVHMRMSYAAPHEVRTTSYGYAYHQPTVQYSVYRLHYE
jgi:hypothetical protein